MKNVYHSMKWNVGMVYQHVEPPLTPLIKINNNDKLDKGFVKLKLRNYPTS